MKILGDYHTHTKFSDGKNSVIEMARTAKERGLLEIAITDHSFGKIIKRLKRKHFTRLLGEVESARSELSVLSGIECNILTTNGLIDLDDEMSKKLDLILLGTHVCIFFSLRAFLTFLLPNIFFRIIRFTPKFQIRHNTKIVKRAIEQNPIDIFTHPNRYFKIDVLEIAKVCAEHGVLMELNNKKISIRPIDFERMTALGAKFVICSDAHSIKRIGDTSRVEEFLKHCDFDRNSIINLERTFTEYANERNKKRDTETQTNRGFFRRWI